MSLLTCCPACATTFKVVPDQLRISDGWVRCGHCTEVFDATLHLQDSEAASTVPSELFGSKPHPLPPAGAAGDSAEAALLTEALAFAGRKAVPAGDGADDAPAAFTLLRADESPSVPPEDEEDEPGAAADRVYRPKPVLLPAAPAAAAPAAEAQVESADEPVSFVQEARRRDAWNRPGVRNAMVLGAGFLSLLLALQYALHDRDWLASRFPALRAPLQALCQASGCTIGAPRQIEAIVIDSSTFNKLRADAYRLSLTLKNTAPMAVAMPALELTLTDARDQPLLRRVLSAAELGAVSPVLAAGSEWSATISLSTPADADPSRIVGYRVLAFYP